MQFTTLMSTLLLVCSAAAVYTGSCTASNCGASAEVCGAGYLCVAYPSFDPATRQGCTCSEA